ncbi:hypothetical protein APTSU1_001386900 [Apodemus speciosus]|uniref:Uncharacterized protein n=1 Tax=Apodemus speciosus TaxID=105296 RepID=A0ABQ0FHA7_APOSI
MLEETELYHWMQREHSQLKKNVDALKQESRNIQEQCALLQQHLGELKLIFNQETTSDRQTQQQQGLERMKEFLQDRHKQKELGLQKKNLAEKPQFHLEVLQKRCFLAEMNQLKKGVEMLKQENKEIQNNCAQLQKLLVDLKSIYKEQGEEASDLQTQHQKHMKRMEEKLQYVLRQKEMALKQKELAEKLQYHFEILQMRSKKLQHEMELVRAQEESFLQNDLLHQEPPAEPRS